MHKQIIALGIILNSTFGWSLWEPSIQKSINTAHLEAKLNDENIQKLEERIIKAIQGTWCSEEKARMLFQLLVHNKPRRLLDVGTFLGDSLIPVAIAAKNLLKCEITALDAWNNDVLKATLSGSDAITSWWLSLDMPSIKTDFIRRLGVYQLENIRILQCDTAVASEIQSENFDFIHLDGDFSSEGSFRDACFFDQLLLPGGILCIANSCILIDSEYTKKKTVQYIFDRYKFLGAADNDNTLFFQKSL